MKFGLTAAVGLAMAQRALEQINIEYGEVSVIDGNYKLLFSG